METVYQIIYYFFIILNIYIGLWSFFGQYVARIQSQRYFKKFIKISFIPCTTIVPLYFHHLRLGEEKNAWALWNFQNSGIGPGTLITETAPIQAKPVKKPSGWSVASFWCRRKFDYFILTVSHLFYIIFNTEILIYHMTISRFKTQLHKYPTLDPQHRGPQTKHTF